MSQKQDGTNQSYTNAYQAYPYYYYPQTSQAYYPVYDTRQQIRQEQQSPQAQQYAQGQQFPQGQQPGATQGMLPEQQSYIENILRLNKGKEATIYMTFENTQQKVFKGIIEAAGRDHVIISDPESGRRYLLLMVYLDYVTFDEEINYAYPYGGAGGQLASYPSR